MTPRDAAFVFLLPAVFVACSDEARYEKPPTPVQIDQVRRQPIGRTTRYSATIEPATRIDLAFRVGGYVTDIATVEGRPIQDGDRVAAGTPLAVVRTTDYEEKIKQAQAQLAEAEATRTVATRALERAEALFAARSLTRPELDQARATVESINARIAGASGLIREAELARGDAALRAPISGVLMKRLVEVGSLVGPGTAAFVVADVSRVKVVIGVPDTMLARFPPGAVALVRSEATPDRRFEGRVTKVSPAADVRSRLFEVELTVGNRDSVLRPGMVAQVTVGESPSVEPAEALLLPLAAIVRPPGKSDGYAVYVVEDRNGVPTARLREVALGDLVGNSVVVVSGVTQADRIIIGGASLVHDGERVNPTS